MTSTSPAMPDLSGRSDLRWLAEVAADLAVGVPGRDALLVGALARDVWLHFLHGQPIARMTTDADFAIAVSGWDEFSTVRDALIAGGAFVGHPTVAHKLRHARHGWIDLVPFGDIEREDGTIAWPPPGAEVMQLLGYAEASAAAVPIALPNDQVARIVTLPMLAVLKVYAWRDRHDRTDGKDAVDLGLILRSYLECGQLDRFAQEFGHLLDEDFDFDSAGAWLLGHDAHQTLRLHSRRFDDVLQRLDSILGRELSPDRVSPLVVTMDRTIPDRGLRQLAAFHAGLLGNARP
jgi:predicted nucleotidyltransferase